MFENEFIIRGARLLHQETDDFFAERYGKIILIFLVLFEPICLFLVAKALERILDRAQILPHVLNYAYYRTSQICHDFSLMYVLKDFLGQVMTALADQEEEAHLKIHEVELGGIIL